MASIWKKGTLAGVCESVKYGYTASASQDEVGPHLLRITDIVPSSIDWLTVPYCTVDDADYEKYKLEEGDIVIARTGATAGYGKLIREDKDSVFASYLVRFRVDTNMADPVYVGTIIESDIYKTYIKSQITGSAQPQANAKILGSFTFPLPSIDEQKRIAHVLGCLDDKIELNRRMNETLERIGRALFKSWFVDFDPVKAKAEDRDPKLPAEIADLFPDSLEESKLGLIPKGWKVGCFADVAMNPRRTVKPNEVPGETPYIGLQDMPRNQIALDTWGKAEDVGSGKFGFKKGEILFGKLRPYFHKVGVAPVDGVCSTDILVVDSKKELWFAYVLGHVSSKEFIDYTTAASTGTRMPRTNWKDMSKFSIVIPAEEIAEAFNVYVCSNISTIQKNIWANLNLANLRDTLLPKLICGEISV